MIKPMDVTPEVTEALAQLRTYAAKYPTMGLSAALNVLDNAGVFAEIDEANDYASAEEILAESAFRTLDEELGARTPTGTGHDSSVCTAGPLASPSQHSGTCPAWARHHNLTVGEDARRASGADEWTQRARAIESIRPTGREPHVHDGCGLDCNR